MFFGCIEFSYVLYGLYDWGATKYQANDQSLHKQSQQSNSILTKDLSIKSPIFTRPTPVIT